MTACAGRRRGSRRRPRGAGCTARRGTGADDADLLVAQLVERRALVVAAGVVVVPTAGVERVTLELFDARNARQLRHVQRARTHPEELGREAIAAVGLDDPTIGRFVPLEVRDLRVEQRVV